MNRRLRRVSQAAVGIALAMTTSLQVASAAEPAGQAGRVQPASIDQTSLAAGGDRAGLSPVPADHTFTLITGDVVALVTGQDGHPAGRVIREAGHPGSVAFATSNDHVFALPRVALALLAEERLDRRLFDLTMLQQFHYDDASSPRLPLIGETGQPRALTDAPPAAATRTRTMDSIGAEALSVDKSGAAEFWGQVTRNDTAPSTLSAGYAKLWLDGVVEASLDTSVPAVGAPAAWQSGFDGKGVTVAVLDTGIDETHPDFAGRITQATSFVPGLSARDGHGHGTHVASTVAGSGAASGGKYRGVAPGANLLVGKVLNDSWGSGAESWIIAGMEWAAAQKARVVSMSLGGWFTDGTDPMSQAVNRLSANNGPLFVIAAGNKGQQMRVGTPAAADSALAVGGVDHRARWAPGPWTSRGPRYGDYAIKPEIAAPGTGITAAAAKVNRTGAYRTLTGTSMATPHVAGAAAILAQEHPGWSRDRLYDSLVSSAKQVPGATPTTYGGGVLDVAAATKQPITATAKANLGTFSPPLPSRATATVTFHNDSATPVTVSLTVDSTFERMRRTQDRVESEKGVTLPAGAASVTPSSVSVPANGSVTAEVGIALAGIRDGSYYGRVAARNAAGTEVAHTIIGWTKAPELHTLDVRGYDIDGAAPDNRFSYVAAVSDSDTYIGVFTGNQTKFFSLVDGSGRYGLPSGNYSVAGSFGARDHDVYIEGRQVVLDRDRQLTFDARKAGRMQVDTPRTSVNYSSGVRWVTKRFGDEAWLGPGFEGYLLPAETPVADYSFQFTTRRAAPPVEAYVADSDVRVRPLLPRVSMGGRPLHDLLAPPSGRFQMVDAGDGTEAGLAGKNLNGKVALVREPGTTNPDQRVIDQQVAAVTKAGAVGLVYAVSKGGPIRIVTSAFTTKIWVTVVTEQEGTQLAQNIEGEQATLVTEVQLPSPYLYDLDFQGRMPADGRYQVTEDNVATVINRFHAPEPGTIIEDSALMDNFWRDVGPLQPVRITRPFIRTDYLSPNHERISLTLIRKPSSADISLWISAIGPLKAGAEVTLDRLGPVMAPGPLFGRTMFIADRWGASFPIPYPWGGDVWERMPYPLGSGVQDALRYRYTARSRVYEGDKVVCDRPGIDGCAITSDGKRRIVIDTSQNAVPFSTRTTTEWTMDIRRPASGTTVPPMIVAQAKPPVDDTNRVRSSEHKVPVRVGYQPGATYQSTFRASAWATFDDGATWVQVAKNLPTRPDSEITLPVEVPSKHNGFVGLRINVVDEQGNAIDQTITRAYGLAIDDHDR